MAIVTLPDGTRVDTGAISGPTGVPGTIVTPVPVPGGVDIEVTRTRKGGGRSKATIPSSQRGPSVIQDTESGLVVRSPTQAEQAESRIEQVDPRLSLARRTAPQFTTEKIEGRISLGGPIPGQVTTEAGEPVFGPRREFVRKPGMARLPTLQSERVAEKEIRISDIGGGDGDLLDIKDPQSRKETKAAFIEFFEAPIRGVAQVIKVGVKKGGKVSGASALIPKRTVKELKEVGLRVEKAGAILKSEKINSVISGARRGEKAFVQKTAFNPSDVVSALSVGAFIGASLVAPGATAVIGIPLVGIDILKTVASPTPRRVGGTAALLTTIGVGTAIRAGKVKLPKIEIKVADRLRLPKPPKKLIGPKTIEIITQAAKTRKSQAVLDRTSRVLASRAINKRDPFGFLRQKPVKTKRISARDRRALRKDIVGTLPKRVITIKGPKPPKAKPKGLTVKDFLRSEALRRRRITAEQRLATRRARLESEKTKPFKFLKSKKGSFNIGKSQVSVLKLLKINIKGSSKLFLVPPIQVGRTITETKVRSRQQPVQQNILRQKLRSTQIPIQQTTTKIKGIQIPKVSQKALVGTVIGTGAVVGTTVLIGQALGGGRTTQRGTTTKQKFFEEEGPGRGGGVFFRGRGAPRRPRQFKYAPSLVSLELGIRGKKPKIITGIGIRPL